MRTLLHLPLVLALAAPSAAAEDPPEVSCKAGDPGVTAPQGIEEGRTPPVLPEDAAAAAIEGRVILRVLVGADGRVADVRLVRAPYRGDALRDASIAAVRAWRYTPAFREGRPIPCWVVESLDFPQPSAPPAAPPPQAAPPAPPREATPAAAAVVPAAAPPLPAASAGPPPAAAGGEALPAPVLAVPTEPPSAAIPPEPAPEPATPPPAPEAPGPAKEHGEAIDLDRGGPAPLLLGARAAEVAASLGLSGSREEGRIRALTRGIEVTLAGTGDDASVAAIRYVFLEGRDGFGASAYRTRSGLGRGSSCLGIPAAHGRPLEREAKDVPSGPREESLRYTFPASRATFLCLDGKLAELTIAATP